MTADPRRRRQGRQRGTQSQVRPGQVDAQGLVPRGEVVPRSGRRYAGGADQAVERRASHDQGPVEGGFVGRVAHHLFHCRRHLVAQIDADDSPPVAEEPLCGGATDTGCGSRDDRRGLAHWLAMLSSSRSIAST